MRESYKSYLLVGMLIQTRYRGLDNRCKINRWRTYLFG